MLTVVKRPMFNGGGEEWYLALDTYPEVPINTPRVGSRDQLIAAFENMLDAARTSEVVEVKE